MLINRIGRKAPSSLSYLLPVTQKDQSTRLKLDENRDLRVQTKEPDLVLFKQQPNQEWAWEPVRSVEELQAFMAQASVEEKSNHLGTWTDSPRLWVFPGDGVIQGREVTPMKERWGDLLLSKEEVEYDRDRGHDCATYSYYSEVVPKKVALKEQTLATGKVWGLEEPRRYVEAEVERVTDWRMTSDGWRPAEIETVVYDAESRKDFR